MNAYFEARYNWWLEAVEHGDVGGLGWYLAGSAARHADDFTDENLAEYVRQTVKLHRYQTLGPARQFLAKLRSDGQRVVKNAAGETALAPTISKPARSAQASR